MNERNLFLVLNHIFKEFFIDGVDFQTKNKLFEKIDIVAGTQLARLHHWDNEDKKPPQNLEELMKDTEFNAFIDEFEKEQKRKIT